jgi:hypothetical protein
MLLAVVAAYTLRLSTVMSKPSSIVFLCTACLCKELLEALSLGSVKHICLSADIDHYMCMSQGRCLLHRTNGKGRPSQQKNTTEEWFEIFR